METKLNSLKVPYALAVILSLIALLEWPYGYYTFLKIVVTFCAGMTAVILHKEENKGFIFWVCIFFAVLFNPIIPIHLTREIWSAFNVLVAGLFGFLAFKCFMRN